MACLPFIIKIEYKIEVNSMNNKMDRYELEIYRSESK